MARKPDVQYIYYADGSAARKLEPIVLPKKKKAPLPRPELRTVTVLRIDPLPVIGLVLAAVMLVLMVVGCVHLNAANAQKEQMQSYVDWLHAENARLQNDYHNGFDLEDIRTSALALGMIPVEEAEHLSITVPVYEEVEEPSAWENFRAYIVSLFA